MGVRLEVRPTFSTSDCHDALHQAARIFEDALVEAARDVEAPPSIRSVVFGLELINPLGTVAGERRRAEFDIRTGTYYASPVLDYGDWIGADWHRRMMAVDRAIRNAIELHEALPLDADLRVALSDASRDAIVHALKRQPASVTLLQPIYLVFTGEEDQRPGVAFERPAHLSFGPWTFVEVHPSEVADYAARYFPPEDRNSSSFRLYLRGEELLFHEAWLAEDRVIEHWGICGGAGDVQEHLISDTAEQADLLAKLRNAAENRGYRPIPVSQQRTIVAQCSVVDMGTDADLDLRYELQDALDQELAHGCVGHCDGGATGGGSMEVYCFVVDIDLGMAAVKQILGAPKFRRFSASLVR